MSPFVNSARLPSMAIFTSCGSAFASSNAQSGSMSHIGFANHQTERLAIVTYGRIHVADRRVADFVRTAWSTTTRYAGHGRSSSGWAGISSIDQVIQVIADHYSLTSEGAREKLADLIRRIEETDTTDVVHYKFYPSEIVRAMEKGYLLEIQEPTVIRDAQWVTVVRIASITASSGWVASMV